MKWATQQMVKRRPFRRPANKMQNAEVEVMLCFMVLIDVS